MSRLVKLLKNKIATGALIGTLIGGATPTIIQSYQIPDNASITTPLALDDINAYGVTIKEFNKKTSNDKFTSITEKQLKQYIDIRDIANFNYTNSINLVISSSWKFDEDSNISRINYNYINTNPDITLDDMEKIITLFKQGKLEEIINNSNIKLQYNYKEYTNSLINEVYDYSAELIVKTIDYNDIKVIKQDKNENVVETLIATTTALIGLRLGIYAGNIYENSSQFIKKKIKEKIRYKIKR